MNQSQKLSMKKNITVGLMLFALFLGAGNIIFPPELGQMAGRNIVISMIGFLITAVGLPLLAVIAIAKSESDFESIASRVHSYFRRYFHNYRLLINRSIFWNPAYSNGFL